MLSTSCWYWLDPYVKIYLSHNGQRMAKKKTHVKKRTLNPVFNESFVFDLPAGATTLDNISLEFLVLDWDRVTKNEVIYTPTYLHKFYCYDYVARTGKLASLFPTGDWSFGAGRNQKQWDGPAPLERSCELSSSPNRRVAQT